MEWVQRIDGIATGYRDAMILAHAVKAGLFESLAEGPRTAAEVAVDRDLDERATDVVMCALAAIGLLERADGRFALAEEAAPYLLVDGEHSMTHIIGHNLKLMRSWLRLDEVLRNGEPAPRDERTPDELRDYICGMADVSRQSSREVANAIDLTGVKRLLDLGGGPGSASIALCEANPELECVLFDLPPSAAIGAEQVAAAGLQERITVQPGDFLTDDLGEGFDVVYASNIVHMLAPDDVQRVLAKARAALVPLGRLMIKDFFLEDDLTTPAWVAQFSVNMLANTRRGKSYPLGEMLELMRANGFGGLRMVDIGAHSRVITGRRESLMGFEV